MDGADDFGVSSISFFMIFICVCVQRLLVAVEILESLVRNSAIERTEKSVFHFGNDACKTPLANCSFKSDFLKHGTTTCGRDIVPYRIAPKYSASKGVEPVTFWV